MKDLDKQQLVHLLQTFALVGAPVPNIDDSTLGSKVFHLFRRLYQSFDRNERFASWVEKGTFIDEIMSAGTYRRILLEQRSTLISDDPLNVVEYTQQINKTVDHYEQRMEDYRDLITTMTEDLALAEWRLAESRRELEQRKAVTEGECWYWQYDGENYPETLSCPVVISAAELNKLIKGNKNGN